MRPTIILIAIFLISCNQRIQIVSTDDASVLDSAEPPDAAATLPDGPVASTIPTITSQPLKPLSAADLRAIRDSNDDIEGPAAAQRKAFRKWIETSKESVALTKAKDVRNALIAIIAKDRKRLPGCLVVLLGKPLDDAEQRAKACGAKQWAIAENGAVVGGK